jgi:hypothetical protein
MQRFKLKSNLTHAYKRRYEWVLLSFILSFLPVLASVFVLSYT